MDVSLNHTRRVGEPRGSKIGGSKKGTMMSAQKIPATLIPGDGIGPEVTAATLEVLVALGAPFEWDTQQAGAAGAPPWRGPPPPPPPPPNPPTPPPAQRPPRGPHGRGVRYPHRAPP